MRQRMQGHAASPVDRMYRWRQGGCRLGLGIRQAYRMARTATHDYAK
jgi:hypothetical protein